MVEQLDLAGPVPEKRDYAREAHEVLAFLNEKTGRSFRHVDVNLNFIIGRLKSGVTVQQCKTVIARMHRVWSKDEKMWEYLRPSTLFNKTNFENYLGACVTPEQEKRK